MGAKRVSKQGVTVSTGNAIEVTNTTGSVLFSVDSTGSLNTLPNLTAKGSILTASAANTPAALAVGNAGETLVADSSTSTGLRWQGSMPAGKNKIINGAMQIWQRGTSFTSNSSTSNYTADRWIGQSNATTTFSRQTTSDTTNLPFIQYCLRIQRNSGATGTDWINVAYSMETVDSIPFAGRTVTMSFYARKGANFNDGTASLYVSLLSGTGTDQNSLVGFTGVATVATFTPTLTTTWQRFSVTGTVSASATQLGINAAFRGAGTAGANDYWELTGVQVELGSVATAFQTATGTLAGELAACQRYYQRFNADGSQFAYFGIGSAHNTGSVYFSYWLKQTMRAVPSTFETSGVSTFFAENSGSVSVSSLTAILLPANVSSKDLIMIEVQKTSSFTAGTFYRLVANTNGNAYIGVGAEL